MLKFLRLTATLPVALFPLLSISLPASAVNWVQVSESLDGSNRLYVDTDSLRQGGSAWYWDHMVYSAPDEDGVKSSKAYISQDCRTGVSRVRKLVAYDSSGRVIKSFNPGDKGPLSEVTPGTIGEAEYRFVCSR